MMELQRVSVWIEVIADSPESAGKWVSAILNEYIDLPNSPVNDFEVTEVETNS